MTGRLREARGHRLVGPLERGRCLAPLGLGERRERHVGAAIAIVTALVGAYTAYSASQAAANAQEAQAQANEYNAKVAQNQQQMSRDAAQVEAEARRNLYKRQMAAQRAALGASGLDASEGSPLLVQMDSAAEAQQDINRVLYAGEVRATGYGAERQLQKFYSRNARRAAGETRIAGYVGAGTALLGGAGRAYGSYTKPSMNDNV